VVVCVFICVFICVCVCVYMCLCVSVCVYVFVLVLLFGENPQAVPLISTSSMFEWFRNLLPHHSQRSSTERWSRNSLRVVTTRMVYVLRGFLTSPFILNNSVETAAPFNDVVSREINPWKSFDLLRSSNLRPLAPSAGCLTARPPELTNVCVCVCLYVFVCVCVTRDKYVPSIYVAGCSLSCSINNPVVKFLISYFQLGGWYNM